MRTPEREMENRKKALAKYLSARGAGRYRVAISRSALAESLALSDSATRTVMRRLVDDGLVTIHSGFRSDGGQKANYYRLTKRGRALAEEG